MVVLAFTGVLLGGFHSLATYFAVEVANLSYQQYLVLIAIVALVVARINCFTQNNWKTELRTIIHSKTASAAQYIDAALFIVIMIAFGIVCHRVVQKHYYLSGLLVSIAMHAMVNGVASCDTF